jgi:hypothetical protein
MPFVETRFISPMALTTSASSALYTVPTGYSAIIKQLVVTNTTGTAATFTFYIGAASAGNALFSATSVAANDTVIINLSQVLATGETLRALASTGSALNLTVSGVLNDGPLASTATYIADNAITSTKIADGAITTAKIADGAVVTVDIANTAVTSAKLADSLAFTGTPTAPTAISYTNSTQIATTAFVNTAIDNVTDGYRNIFINGGFAVDQRGKATSHTVTAGAALSYTVDRWYEYCTGANVTAARVVYSPLLGAAQNPYYYYRFTGATSNTLVGFAQRIETANLLGVSGAYCTLSARMCASTAKTVTWTAYYANTTDSFGTLASPTRTSIATGTFAVTTTETNFSTYFQIPSSVTGVEIVFTCPTLTSGQTMDFGNMQLEKGLRLTPTPFEQRPIGVELALCQRYYWKHSSSAGISYLSFQYAGTQYRLTIPNPVQMRINPHTVTTSTWQGGTTPSLGAANVLSTNWSTTGGWFYVDGSTSIEISSEL